MQPKHRMISVRKLHIHVQATGLSWKGSVEVAAKTMKSAII